jgi:hypothetical protein
MDFLVIKGNPEACFENIAEKLFFEYAIETHSGSVFRITEAEFYWQSDTHEDKSTYERKHADPEMGEWFFHYSGVDISLRDRSANGYGGILIRSIREVTGDKPKTYKGPMVCATRLFSGINAFNGTKVARLVPLTFPKTIVETSGKIGLGKVAKESGADKLQYRFFLKPGQF